MNKEVVLAKTISIDNVSKESYFLAYGDTVEDANNVREFYFNHIYKRRPGCTMNIQNVSDGFASLVSTEKLTNKFLLFGEKVVEITEKEARDIQNVQYEIETCDSKEEQEKIRALNIFLNKREANEANEEWTKEADVWFNLYMDFNDNNFRHADNCFVSNRFYEKTIEELHAINLNFVIDTLNAYKGNASDMLKDAKYAEPYLEEAIKKGLAYAEEKDSKTIRIPTDMVEKIRKFCKDELDWHINECEPEEYADECEAEIFLLRSLGFTDLADEYEKLYKAAVEED